MTGPRAMLQISFHTNFADTNRHINFFAEDIDVLQARALSYLNCRAAAPSGIIGARRTLWWLLHA